MKNPMLFLVFVLFISTSLSAQLLTTGPSFPKDTSTVNITIDVSKGNKGLLDYTQTDDVYVHVGAILGNDGSQWDSVPYIWATTPLAARATYLGNNRYRYTISNIRSFFKIPEDVPIKKVAILLRNGAGTRVQRNADGSDMFFEIYDGGLAGRFVEPAIEPKFIPVPEPIEKQAGEEFRFTYIASQTGVMRLYHNGTEFAFEPSSTLIQETIVINNSGNHQIVGRSVAGGITVSDTLNIFVAPGTAVEALPQGLRDGINFEEGDTSVILVLYAPGKTRVSVLGDFNNWTETAAHQMKLTPDSSRFWVRIIGLQSGVKYGYQYNVSGLRIADPYAELVLDPNNDPFIDAAVYPDLKAYPAGKTTGIVSVLETGKASYQWQVTDFNRPDQEGLIVYELLLRDFLNRPDWKTLEDTLTYLKRLGINAIELLPFNEFEGNISWGYNPSFYFTPDKYYGPADRLKSFIDACHREGIAVIMDIALNHQFGQSPLVQLFFDAAAGRPSANNPWFNPVPKHGFNVGYDMNHESAATKYFSSRVIEHWLTEYRIDGFRFDLSKGFTQTNSCDLNGENCNTQSWSNEDAGRIAIWKAYYDTVQLKSEGAYVILEHFAANSEEKILSDYGMMFWGNLNHAFAEASMGYLQGSDFSGGFAEARGWDDHHLITYMESHDEERIVFKNINFGNSSGGYNIKEINTALKRAEQAAAFFLMIPGPKMIWQFGELGYDYSINYCEDGTINNDCRTGPKPVKWDYLQQASRKRLFDVYSGLLRLRNNPFYTSTFTTDRVEYKTDGAFKWIKLITDTSDIIIIGNFDLSAATAPVTFSQAGTWYNYLSGTTFNATGNAQNITLQAGEYQIFLNRNITNVLTPVRDLENLASKTHLNVYPNPAGRESMIAFEIPESGKVTMTLKNTIGQTVGSSHASFRLKGRHSLGLNELLRSMETLRPGNYFLVMDFGDFRKARQIIISK